MKDEALIEQIAFNLQKPGFDLAFVIHRQKIYAAYCPKNFEGPSSAIIKLIQGLFDVHQDQSFFILRNRLYTTDALKARCQGMIKIIAKKGTGEVQSIDHSLPVTEEIFLIGDERPFAQVTLRTPENNLPLEQIAFLKSKEDLEWVRKVAALNPRGEVLHDYDRDIACVLVDKSGDILGYGLNCNSKNKTLHAEVNLVQRLFHETGKKIPAGSVLLTTRKPCKMCAGMLYDWSEDPRTLSVHFAEEDRSSQQTVLDAVAHWKRLDEP